MKYSSSYLSPRFKLMEPVRVYAGVRSVERPVILPHMLPQLPLYAPREKSVLPLKQQKGSLIKLVQMPRSKP